MDTWFDPAQPDKCILTIGDMKGVAYVLNFNEATTRLFNEVPKWQENQCTIKDMEAAPDSMRGQPSRVSVYRYQLHSEDGDDMMNQSSLKVMYIPQLEGFYSCAKTKAKSLVFFSMDAEKAEKDRTRTFDIPKGCNSFDFYTDTGKDGHHMIITGGNDKCVRFWNPYVPTYPIATLTGHRSTILNVMANSVNKQVLTLAEEEIIKIWDVEACVCLNTLGAMIPHHLVQYSSDTQSRCLWHEPTQTLLVSTYTELACVMMSRDNVTATHSSHDMPVAATTYIEEFNIIATGCVGGTIICWDLSSGRKIISYDHAHGAAVSTLTVCVGGRRLLSGASNGEIYVWGTLSGMLLQKLVKKNPSEVAGIFSTHHRIYSAGWDRKLISFVSNNDIDLAKVPDIIYQDEKWDPSQQHSEDITSMDTCGESLVATGSFDGTIIIWNVKLAKAVNQFDAKTFRTHLHMARFADADASPAARDGQQGFLPDVHSSSRPSVDVIVWLQARIKKMAASRMRGENSDDGLNVASIAVACDGGCINFWNAIKGDLLGGFHAVADQHGADWICSMAVNKNSTRLYTGDTVGHVKIYDIETYCVKGRDSNPPRVVEEWRAHMHSVSALTYIEAAKLLVTSSLDQSVRVWNAKTGAFIGTFGGSSWSLPIRGRPSIAAPAQVTLSHHAAAKLKKRSHKHRILRMATDQTGMVEEDEDDAVVLPKHQPCDECGEGKVSNSTHHCETCYLDLCPEHNAVHIKTNGSSACVVTPIAHAAYFESGASVGGGLLAMANAATSIALEQRHSGGKSSGKSRGAPKQVSLPPVIEVEEAGDLKGKKKAAKSGSIIDFPASPSLPTAPNPANEAHTLKEAEASDWDNSKRSSKRATAVGAAILGREFALPNIKKQNEDYDVSEYQEATGNIGAMASRIVHDSKFKSTAQGRDDGALFEPLDWERECVLGQAFSKRAIARHSEKQDWRKVTPRPDLRRAEIPGLQVCMPFTTLRLEELEKVKQQRVPTAVSRVKKYKQVGGQLTMNSISPERRKGGGGSQSPSRSPSRCSSMAGSRPGSQAGSHPGSRATSSTSTRPARPAKLKPITSMTASV